MAEESKLVDKLQEKTKEIKFTDEELAKLREIQQDYLECQLHLVKSQFKK